MKNRAENHEKLEKLQAIFVNDLKLSDFKNLLFEKGYKTEFLSGTLLINGSKSQLGSMPDENTVLFQESVRFVVVRWDSLWRERYRRTTTNFEICSTINSLFYKICDLSCHFSPEFMKFYVQHFSMHITAFWVVKQEEIEVNSSLE